MYAIIYWINDDQIYPHLTYDNQLKLFDTLKEADHEADYLERKSVRQNMNDEGADTITKEARVISIEGVN